MRYLLIFLCLIAANALAQSESVKTYLTASRAYTKTQPDSAVRYANEGIKLAEKQNDRGGEAALLVQLGEINALHHHTGLTRSFYNEALGIYRRLDNAAGIAHTYDQLGLLDGNPQNFSQALKYDRDSSVLAETYESIGRNFEEKNDHEAALSYYLRALAQQGHPKQRSGAYFALLENIADVYQKKGDSRTALQYLQAGIRTSETQGSRDTEVHLMNAEGRMVAREHEPLKALALFKRALAAAKKYRQPDEQAEALIQIAGILKKQDAGASIADLKQALRIAQNLHEPSLQARIFQALSGVYRQQRNYVEAMAALEDQHRLLDSLLQADTSKDVAALDSSYLLERSREKVSTLEDLNRVEKISLNLGLATLLAILLLVGLFWRYLRKIKQLNTQLENMNAELTNSNRVKDTLFSVIGHDLKGPAGSAAQLFEMMETEDFTPEEMKSMISELRKQTTASLQLLQALFEWGKAQLQGIKVDPSAFEVRPVVERCIHLLSQQAAHKHIRLLAELPAGFKVFADANHFEFMIRNLLSNAIKFSYEGGTVSIGALSDSGGERIMTVKDQGIGISAEQQEVFQTGNLKVSFGTKKEQGSGLGLLLTKDFIKANHGRIWLKSEEGKGTTVFVAMPAG